MEGLMVKRGKEKISMIIQLKDRSEINGNEGEAERGRNKKRRTKLLCAGCGFRSSDFPQAEW